MRARAASRPSRDGATRTTALRRVRGRSGPVVSSMKRRAAALGRPESEDGSRPQNGEMEVAVVLDVARPLGQRMDPGARRRRALGQAPGPPDLGEELLLDELRRDAIRAGVVVHLLEVRPVAETPPPGQYPRPAVRRRGARELRLVEEPGEVRPAAQALLELDAVGASRADECDQLRRMRLLADRLRAQERGDHRLFHLAVFERRLLVLDCPRLGELAFEHRTPHVAGALRHLAGGDARKLARRLGEGAVAGHGQEHVGSDQRRRVPSLGVAQCDGEGPQDAARALEPVQLRPLGVEDVGQVRVEGIAVEEALLRVHPILAHGLVDPGDAGHGRGDVRTEGVGIGDRFGGEEAPAQHLGHVLLLHRLDALFPLPVEDVEDLCGQRLAERVALRGVGREQRGDEGAAVDLGHRLAEILEEVDQPAAPRLRHRRLLAGVHQHLVDQDQGRKPVRLRPRQQVGEQRLGGRCLAFLVRAVRVERAQARFARDLEREHAPGMLQPAKLARRPAHFHAFLHVELVEAERGDARRRQRGADVRPELVHRGQGRQPLRIVDEVA